MRDVRDDAGQAEVEEFLAKVIADPTRLSIPPRDFYRKIGSPNDVIVIEDAAGIAAAIHASISIEDYGQFMEKGLADIAGHFLTKFWMIHSLAVRPDVRRSGLGGELLHAVEQRARDRGMTTLAGIVSVNTPAAKFYAEQGFTVQDGGMFLEVPTKFARVRLPEDDPKAAWFYKSL